MLVVSFFPQCVPVSLSLLILISSLILTTLLSLNTRSDPRTPQSLHYLNPYSPNEYYQAIQQVGDILQYYDADKQFPAFGFGAKIPPARQVSHCFPLTLNPQQVEVNGVKGILDAYMGALQQVSLYGPTNFSEVLPLPSLFVYFCV